MKFSDGDKKLYQLSDRGRQLVEALPDRAKVNALKAKWWREDRRKPRPSTNPAGEPK